MAMCNIYHEKLFTQNVTNATFSFQTSPNKTLRENCGGHGILCPPVYKVGGHVPRVPHQIAPMSLVVTELTKLTIFSDRNRVSSKIAILLVLGIVIFI